MIDLCMVFDWLRWHCYICMYSKLGHQCMCCYKYAFCVNWDTSACHPPEILLDTRKEFDVSLNGPRTRTSFLATGKIFTRYIVCNISAYSHLAVISFLHIIGQLCY